MHRISLQETFNAFYISRAANPDRLYARREHPETNYDTCVYYHAEGYGCAIGQALISRGLPEVAQRWNDLGIGIAVSLCPDVLDYFDVALDTLHEFQMIHDEGSHYGLSWIDLKFKLKLFAEKHNLTIPEGES